MRKISKISLVAAVAVAGFSTANAQPLEEAIKNVDVSGSVVYRYDNAGNNALDAAGNKTGNTLDRNRYKIGLNLSSKVNDYVKFNSRFIVGGADSGWAATGAKKNGTNVGDNRTNGDGNPEVSLSNAYFGFTAIPNTIVNVGKQGLTTPYTVAVDINGSEQNGTGILALSTFGPITAGAGYFNNTNFENLTEINLTRRIGSGSGTYNFNLELDAGRDMYVATVQGDLDFVKLEAWYAGLQNTFNSYTFAATSKIDLAENAKLGLEARYVALNLTDDVVGLNKVARNNHLNGVAGVSNNGGTDNGMFRLAVDGKFSIVNARLAYTKTDKEGGLTALDQDAKNTSLGWYITSNGYADADYFQAALGVDILDNLNFTAHYGNLSSDTQSAGAKFVGLDDTKAEEIYGQLTYKMSKNLSTYLRYGNYEQKEKSTGTKQIDQDLGRLQVAYTF